MEALLRSGATVWSLDDLRVLWREVDVNALRGKAKYYADRQRLLRVRKGIYALSRDYNPYELAQKLIRPSYISLESALRAHGVIRQYSSVITCIALYPREILVDGRTYRYHQMKGDILACPVGIEQRANYAMATPERAICDALYLGFQPDAGRYRQWDVALLCRLEKEFSVPRVTEGLSHILTLRVDSSV